MKKNANETIILKVFKKTHENYEEEKEMVKKFAESFSETPRKVCPTYVKISDKSFDTWHLKESQIISCIKTGLANENFEFCCKLTKALKKNQTNSLSMLYNMICLKAKYGKNVDELIKLMGLSEKLRLAVNITRFNKEANMNFSALTSKEVLTTISQMIENEITRNSIKN